MKIITLLTDFGTQDGYPAIMKGIIWSIAPGTHIADISHEVPPQDVAAGARLLERAAPFFPPGTVHIGVVDPGVGTGRRPIAAQLGQQFFVGPDNGLVTMLLDRTQRQNQAVEVVALDQPRYWLPVVSNTFHGRDIFAPVGAALVNGVSLSSLGSNVVDPQRLDLPGFHRTAQGWRGEVVHIDHFGNLATNLPADVITTSGKVSVHAAGKVIPRLSTTFGEGEPGDLIAVIDSSNLLSIAVVNGNAQECTGAKLGEPVEVIQQPA
ncbi:MAG: SAM-dependent chlorinase/fluorinase [Anaerolineae bacterium]|nr:SAM-dependent chlorinase/fluorinase [Anaerolineae bacterium]